MVDRTFRQRLDYFCENWAELTDDQGLDIMKAAPEAGPREQGDKFVKYTYNAEKGEVNG